MGIYEKPILVDGNPWELNPGNQCVRKREKDFCDKVDWTFEHTFGKWIRKSQKLSKRQS